MRFILVYYFQLVVVMGSIAQPNHAKDCIFTDSLLSKTGLLHSSHQLSKKGIIELQVVCFQLNNLEPERMDTLYIFRETYNNHGYILDHEGHKYGFIFPDDGWRNYDKEEEHHLYSYKYVADNKLSERKIYSGTNDSLWLTSTSTYFYNSEGRIETDYIQQENQKVPNIMKYTYNKHGNVKKIAQIPPNRSLLIPATYKYDCKKKTMTIKSQWGSYNRSTIYQYDDKYLLTTYTLKKGWSTIATRNYFYNKDNKLEKIVTFDKKSKLQIISEVNYNNDGFVATIKDYIDGKCQRVLYYYYK